MRCRSGALSLNPPDEGNGFPGASPVPVRAGSRIGGRERNPFHPRYSIPDARTGKRGSWRIEHTNIGDARSSALKWRALIQ